MLVFGSRTNRLHNNQSIVTETRTDLFLYHQTNLTELAELLVEMDIDVNEVELIWAGQTLGWRYFRPGRYELDGSYSYGSLLSKMARGLQDPARVTILPGSDIGRLSGSLSSQMRADSAEFHQMFSDSSSIALEFGLTGQDLFARMLPNTYEIYWTATAENTIRRILNEFQRLIADRYKTDIEEHKFSLHEILTLASIVQWEARGNDEKPTISGLYMNRLGRNMMLQADPTITFALGERRRLLFEDYRFEHPYNTYLVAGLPPGPITNPDIASIRAVLDPEEHDYLYMVATPDGNHHFSRTFQEHREASEIWRRWIREQYRIRDEREKTENDN